MRPIHSAAIALLASALSLVELPAQIVHFTNYWPGEFHGWKRATIDVPVPYSAGVIRAGGRAAGRTEAPAPAAETVTPAPVPVVAGERHDDPRDVRYVLGRRIGLDARVVDVHLHLGPGERRSVDLRDAEPVKFQLPMLSADAIPALLGGEQMELVAANPDGAAWVLHHRARSQRTLVVDVWTVFYPDQPGWASAEATVTSSHPGIADAWEIATPALTLDFDSAFTSLPGAGVDVPLLPVGQRIVDGQTRAVPATFVWPDRFPKGPSDTAAWTSTHAVGNLALGAVGIRKILPYGNPRYPAGFSAQAWISQHHAAAVSRLHNWRPGVCGPDPNAKVTGDQPGEQIFVRGEALLPGGAGAEIVTWLSGLKIMGRPCHFREADGSPVRWQDHPRCVIWEGRPHYHPSIGLDQLGAAGLTDAMLTLDGTLWKGPDREHWMLNTVAAGARLTGSYALQAELSAQAQLFMMQETVPSTHPWSTTNGPDAARSVGYAGMVVTRLHQDLEDRALAGAVVGRWHRRVLDVYAPTIGSRDIWDARADGRIQPPWWDPATAPKPRWMPWQQALGAYGLYEACWLVGPAEGLAVAVRGARAVLQQAYVLRNGVYVDLDYPAVVGDAVAGDPDTTELFYRQFGMPLAAATVLRHDPTDPLARAIWNQLVAGAQQPKHWQWLSPWVR